MHSYVQVSALDKIWHIAQISPVSKEHVTKLSTAIVWFIRKGTIFRVPLSTLQVISRTVAWNY
jgi:hypothetical protein